jgi:hypothetical protein
MNLRLSNKLLKSFLLFVGTFMSYSTFAQNAAGSMNQDMMYGNGGFIRTVHPNSKIIIGSPYINTDWQDATLKTEKNQVFNNLKLKYDVYQNEVLLLKPDGDSVALLPNIVSEFTITNIKLKQSKFKRFNNLKTDDNNLKSRYLNVIYENKVVLGKLLTAKILPADKIQGTYGSQRLNDEYEKTEAYYFINKEQIPTKVKLSKKSLLEVLADKKEKVDTYIKTEKIDASSEAGWAKTLAYYETL